jgi:hypothetical protein
MRKLACSTIVLLALWAPPMFAESTTDTLLAPELLERLTLEGELRNSLSESSPLKLIPEVTLRPDIEERINELELSVGTEVLTLYRNEAIDFDAEGSRLKIYTILRSISTMEGIEYYSASRKRMRTLFAQSYVIDGPEKLQRIPDPLVQEIPAYTRLYVFQEDLTFGENVYRWEYRYSGQYFLVTNRNTTTMRYFLLPMVKPEQSVTYILVIPAGREILFYGVTGAHTMSFFGLERTREDSFYNRLKAIYGWFTERIADSF